MKKLIAVAAILSVMFLGAGPSHALVGMPDDVPGTNILQPFFLVDMAGYATDTGLDTLIIITDVSGLGPVPSGFLDLVIRDKESVHRGDERLSYTPNDVLPLSVRDMLKLYVGVNDLVNLEYDLDNDGVNDTYVGYIDWTGGRFADAVVDNLMAQMYVIDLANGRAAGTNAPAREDASAALYDPAQNNGTPFEVFTGSALAESDRRTRGVNAPAPADLILTPRWSLMDANATNYLFIWTSRNHGFWANPFTPDVYEVVTHLYDADENGISINFNLPYELNIIDVREELPGNYTPIGGWIEIAGTGEVPTLGDNVEWLAYSYQIAESASAGLNWSGLFDAHRNIADFVMHP